jgi:hypothetical protein
MQDPPTILLLVTTVKSVQAIEHKLSSSLVRSAIFHNTKLGRWTSDLDTTLSRMQSILRVTCLA